MQCNKLEASLWCYQLFRIMVYKYLVHCHTWMLLLSCYTQQFDGLNQIFCRVTCNETLTSAKCQNSSFCFFYDLSRKAGECLPVDISLQTTCMLRCYTVRLFKLLYNLICVVHVKALKRSWQCLTVWSHDLLCSECTRGGFCNFMHLRPISRDSR